MADSKISALPASTVPLAGTEVLPIVQSSTTKQVSVANLTAGRDIAATSLTTAAVQATNSGGLALKNASGTTQLLVGGGGGDNITLSVATNITPANAAVAISPTGTGTVAISPAGALTINPTTASTINNTSVGATIASTGRFTSVTATTGNFVVGTSGQGVDFSATPGAAGATSELFADYEEGTFTPTISYSGGNGTLSYAVQIGRYTKVGRTVQVEAYIEFSPGTASGNLRANLPFAATGVTNMYVAVPVSLNGFSALVGGIFGLIVPGTSILDIFYTGTGGIASVTATNTGATPWVAYCFTYEV